jgi:signal transduction histidine kinase
MLRAFLGYTAVLAVVFLLVALPVHVVMAYQYRVIAAERLKIMAHDGEEVVERVSPGQPLKAALASVLKSPDEGLIWYDAAERPLAHSGATAGQAMRLKVRVTEETADGWIEAVIPSRRITSALSHLDFGLGIGWLIAAISAGFVIAVTSRRAVARVEEALQRVHRFTGDAAHELRTPLAVIVANADPVVYDGGTDPASDRRITNIRQAAGQMRKLVDDLLILSRFDEGVRRDLHVVDIQECAANAVQRYRADAEQRGIALRFHPADGCMVYAQPCDIERIVGNLVENALRYTTRGGSVDVSCAGRRNVATVTVADTGIGLQPGELARIFDRFWRAPGQAPGEGSGLGLAIARDLARAHGGDVSVTSVPEKGSVFTLVLPTLGRRAGTVSTSSRQS